MELSQQEVIKAVNELEGDIRNAPPCSRPAKFIYKSVVNNSLWRRGELVVDDQNYSGEEFVKVCSVEEFNQCVVEMTNYKISSPIYTDEMKKNKELPSVGVECNFKTTFFTLPDSNKGTCKIIAYHADKVWVDMGKSEFVINVNVIEFKPLTPPIELIDGKAYQFNYVEHEKVILGFYSKSHDDFTVNGTLYNPRMCTNITLLTPEK